MKRGQGIKLDDVNGVTKNLLADVSTAVDIASLHYNWL